MTAPGQPGMILMVRVWMDGADQDLFRARLTSSTDNLISEEPIAASSTVTHLLDEVRRCLEAFCTRSEMPGELESTRPDDLATNRAGPAI